MREGLDKDEGVRLPLRIDAEVIGTIGHGNACCSLRRRFRID